ncbi:MAG: ribosome assembly cofactor RimP [Ferruginibacter sp.]
MASKKTHYVLTDLAVYYILPIFAPEIRNRKEGNRRFPSSFYKAFMSGENQIEIVQKLLHPLLTDDIFLVDIRIKPINNIKIYLDADNGLGIEKCIKINRALYKIMEEMGIYPEGDFSLEVSSPGIGEPLKLYRQYIKNIGRELEVEFKDSSKKTGKLTSVNETELIIEFTEGKNKKAVVKQETILFSDIKETIVLIKF